MHPWMNGVWITAAVLPTTFARVTWTFSELFFHFHRGTSDTELRFAVQSIRSYEKVPGLFRFGVGQNSAEHYSPVSRNTAFAFHSISFSQVLFKHKLTYVMNSKSDFACGLTCFSFRPDMTFANKWSPSSITYPLTTRIVGAQEMTS